jgi:hypothetical protein
MIRTISAATEAGLQSMKRDVPVDTGDLRSTCQKRDDGNGHTMLMAGGPSQISDNFVDYELHVEFGTVNMWAQPFFRPAIEMVRDLIKREMRIRQ